MTIHYHGLPLTPKEMLYDLAGQHVCISFATELKSQTEMSLNMMQSIMFDNGAFSLYRKGGKLDHGAYYKWLAPKLGHPHWAVVPDVIDGSIEEQRELVKTWPYEREFGAPVWHLGLPIDYLLELTDEWPMVCLGSSGKYWKVGSPDWRRRMDEATEALMKNRIRAPRLHGLRMMAQAGKHWPLASVDSVNISRNFKDYKLMPSHVAYRLNKENSSTNRYAMRGPDIEALL